MELKSLHKDAIPNALAKAERYRLLHEPLQSESICQDILQVDPENQPALVILLLALTDQFGQAYKVQEAKDVLPRLTDPYERAYYSGIVAERRAYALLHQSRHASGSAIYDWLREAMDFYEKAETIRPPANDDALLRWNTCARALMRNPHLQPAPRERTEPIMSEQMPGELWLIRHGETEWSRSGAHTGRTDLPLTDAGCREAQHIARELAGRKFALVLTSPLQRARETCRLAGYGDVAEVEPNLQEWNYGDYEGRSTSQIREQRPGWSMWTDGFPNGETIEQVAARADAILDRAARATGDVALFGHGHILRILTTRWLGLPPADARLFALGTASISTLGYERETRVINRWNLTCL